MSNPGILVLFSETKGVDGINYLQIEDNIGESVHLHINDFRFDLTLSEFDQLSDMFLNALTKFEKNDGRLLKSPQFLAETYKYFNYERINYEIEKVLLKKLKFIVRKSWFRFFYYVYVCEISNTPQYKLLKGEDQGLDERFQYSPLQQNEITRLQKSLEHVKNYSQDISKYNIITYGKNYIVRDGLHTSSSFAHVFGENSEVEVIIITNEKTLVDMNSALFWSIKSTIKTVLLLLRRLVIMVVYNFKIKRF